MKKLNRKGFTLVELLAVIVILAIVVGISIPSVTSIINGSKLNAMSVAVESALDHLKDEYDIFNVDSAAAGTFVKYVISQGNAGVEYNINDADATKRTAAKEAFEELGFKESNVNKLFVKVYDDSTLGKATFCVSIKEIPQKSEYFVTSYWDLTAGAAGAVAGTAVPTGTGKHELGNGC